MLVAAAVSATTTWALSGGQQAQQLKMRYCQRFINGYTSATPNVSCKSAKSVVKHITGPRCLTKEQCDVGRFVCVSYYSEFGFSKPFQDSHHGLCVARHARRIEFDLG
jgi:hypothetical protein